MWVRGDATLCVVIFDCSYSYNKCIENHVVEYNMLKHDYHIIYYVPQISRATKTRVNMKTLNPDIRKRVLVARPHLYGLRLINYRAI